MSPFMGTMVAPLSEAIARALPYWHYTLRNVFNNSPQGVWYDPSDTTTLFQDSAGTTPVTASGQPVGLMLDKSKGLVRGVELINDPELTLNNSGGEWIVQGNVVFSGGSVTITTDGSLVFIAKSGVLVAGKTYEVMIDITSNTGASIAINTGAADTVLGVVIGMLTLKVKADTTVFQVKRAGGSAGGSFTVTSISIKELPGNHATQPTAASRPIYRRGDSRGVVNLLTWSEDFGNSVWTKTAISVSSGAFGEVLTDASGASFGELLRDVAVNTSTAYCVSFVVTKATSQTSCPGFSLVTSGGAAQVVQLTFDPATGAFVKRDSSQALPLIAVADQGDVWRVAIPLTTGGSTTSVRIDVFPAVSPTLSAAWAASTTGSIELVSAQLNLGPTALPYQRNDGNLGGVATGASTDLHWLETDGVDDGMVTGNIDFTGTDKVSVFAGLRTVVPGISSAVVELSANSTNTAGTFAIFAPLGAVAYHFRSGGSVPASGVVNSSDAALLAPHSGVATGFAQISVDSSVLRVNGVLRTTSAVDQGTGNYGNYPLYLFRRGGVSLPFNGWFYGLAITGRLTTNAETVATERYLAAKSAVVIP